MTFVRLAEYESPWHDPAPAEDDSRLPELAVLPNGEPFEGFDPFAEATEQVADLEEMIGVRPGALEQALQQTRTIGLVLTDVLYAGPCAEREVTLEIMGPGEVTLA